MSPSPSAVAQAPPARSGIRAAPADTATRRVLHVTSVHPIGDVRIFGKECRSLAAHGYDVTLMGPGGGGERVEGVRLAAVPGLARPGRLRRMLSSAVRVTSAALGQRAEIHHFHDPELMLMGFVLKALGRRVVYDVHEDLPRELLIKAWISPRLRGALASVMTALEALAGRAFDGIVAATPTIAARFPPAKTVLVRNFPRLEEFTASAATAPHGDRPFQVAYVGLLSEARGLLDMIHAAGRVTAGRPAGWPAAPLVLAGRFASREEEAAGRASLGWPAVDYRGWLDRRGIAQTLGQVRAGVVVLRPSPAYVASYPIKMFEYMAAGLPVIASDFRGFREILDDGACGLLVEPGNPAALAAAVRWIFGHPAEAEVMGRRGRRRVEALYTWEAEEVRLLELYRRLLAPPTLAGSAPAAVRP